MNIDDKTREKILAILKKAAKYCLTSEEKELINLFENPIAVNMGFNITDYTFSDEPDIPRFEYKHIKHLIRKGKLFFDFSKDAEEDKKFYEENNDEWKDEYSYNKVSICDSDYDSEFGENEADAFFVMEDDEGAVDPCRFDIREIIYVDETHFDVIDRGCHAGIKCRFIIR
jgi:hypothetical protein